MAVTDDLPPAVMTTLSPQQQQRLEAYLDAVRRPRADRPAAATPPAREAHAPGHGLAAARTGMWLFLATEVMMFGGLFCLYGVYRYLSPEAFQYGQRFLDTGWGLINTIAMILSSFTMALAVHCARTGQRQPLMLFLSLTIICGVCFLGVKAIEYGHKADAGLLWSSRFAPVIDEPAPSPVGPVDAAAPAAPVAHEGDPAAGRPLYMATCIGCHGAGGEGVPGLGPALKSSSFVAGSSLEQLRALITDGRQPDAPDSIMNALMPPRGGNPFLGEDQIADIAAYVRSMNAGAAATAETGAPAAIDEVAADVGGGEADALAALPRWVGTRPPEADAGLAVEWRMGDGKRPVAAALPLAPDAVPAQAAQFFSLYFLMTGLHGVHLVIAMCVVGWLLWRASRPVVRDPAPVELGGLFWHMVDLVWLVLFPLFYLVG